MRKSFEAKLVAMGPSGGWTHMPIPFSVPEVFGTRARLAVRGTINGVAFRSSLMPRDGGHYLNVNKQMLAGAKAAAGDTVQVVLEPDSEERTVEVPADLRKALGAKTGKLFDALSYSHRKEFVDWIEQAKRPETRAKRIEKTLEMVVEKKRPGD